MSRFESAAQAGPGRGADRAPAVLDVGQGDAILLLHGFPHTRHVWRLITPALVAAGHRVLAPNLRGIGEAAPPLQGYDAATQAEQLVALFDASALKRVHVVGFDLGAAPAFALAALHPQRVTTLTMIEAVVSGLPGAETFFTAGAPWWFGLHQVPGGFAEDIVAGSEDRYVRHFLDTGSRGGVPEDLAKDFVDAYTGRAALRAAFEHYRAMPSNGDRNASWAASNRLTMPVIAIGAEPVGDVTARQLAPFADDLQAHVIPGSGHIMPLDVPDALAAILLAGFARVAARQPER